MDKLKLLWSKTNRWHRAIFIFLIVELRILPRNQLGFRCNNPALSYPFTGDTITWKHLFSVILLLPIAILLIVERTYHRDKNVKPKRQALKWYKEYIFGLLLNLTVVQGLKLVVGAPRPHFFDTCSPNEAITCQGSEYISRYTCTKSQWLSESDKSFPSGHTSLAVHAGFFLIYYLHRRATRTHPILVIQILLLVASIYCGVSRMLDHRHHWWDVTAGAIIGVPILIYTCYTLCQNFECNEDTSKPGENQHILANDQELETKAS